VDGDTVIALAGTYVVSGPFIQLGTGETLRGAAGSRPVIQSSGGTIPFEANSSNPAKPARVSHLKFNAPRIDLTNSIGSDLVVSAADGLAAPVYLSQASLLRDSLVTAAGDDSTAVTINNTDTFTAVLRNVTAVATGASSFGIQVFGAADDMPGGCFMLTGRGLVQNTIARGTQADLSARGSQSGACPPSEASLTVSYSNFRTVEETGFGVVTEGAGNQRSAAQTTDAAIFADTTAYRQREGAPTYNAGEDDAADAGFVDPDGDPRVGDGNVDIGADELPTAPVVSTAAATAVAASSAEVNGSVDPQSEDLVYRFEFGSTNALGFNTAEKPLDGSASATPIQETLSGLAPSQTVFYRAYARSTGLQPRTSVGDTMSFTTLSNEAPAVVTDPATKVNATSALLHGSVTPNGYPTTWQFDFGKTSAYGKATSAGDAGAGQSAVPVSAELKGLAPRTTYHYRLQGTNQIDTAFASDATFTTKRLKIRGLKVKPKRFRIGSDLPKVARVGTVIKFRLNGKARVTLKFLRKTADGLVPKGKLKYKAKPGKQRIRFDGRLSKKKKLKPGKYKLVVRAKLAGTRSKKISTKFRLLPKHR
jgi:hypothetical protein